MDLKGEILVNGQPWTEDFNRIAGFVTQEDFHIRLFSSFSLPLFLVCLFFFYSPSAITAQMTVRETFMFSSQLRNHPLVSLEKKKERVCTPFSLLSLFLCSSFAV